MNKKASNKVFFKQCSLNKKLMFAFSKCIVPISVGIHVHEGEKFLETMRLINAHFQECTLLIDDSIQRYTMKIENPNLQLDDLHIKAVQLGDEWIERNKHNYNILTIPYNIMRWDNWRNHRDFNEFYKVIEKRYNDDVMFKQAIHDNISDFIKDRYLNVDQSHAFNCCLKYLMFRNLERLV